ncbi:hypothetical protein L2E82_32168 [Cichorium intybus]|uniref:Uncharacterized protein n=1 Tax=Cichorium intybus TaxID=13427 RepID=A0ACB9BGT4_CICIN|nr:hypothetical protein L2E82_32168 [Cichorium intybus]
MISTKLSIEILHPHPYIHPRYALNFLSRSSTRPLPASVYDPPKKTLFPSIAELGLSFFFWDHPNLPHSTSTIRSRKEAERGRRIAAPMAYRLKSATPKEEEECCVHRGLLEGK